jgi:hypothetical protein
MHNKYASSMMLASSSTHTSQGVVQLTDQARLHPWGPEWTRPYYCNNLHNEQVTVLPGPSSLYDNSQH